MNDEATLYRRGAPIASSWLNHVAKNVLSRISVVGGRARRSGNSLSIVVDPPPANTQAAKPFLGVVVARYEGFVHVQPIGGQLPYNWYVIDPSASPYVCFSGIDPPMVAPMYGSAGSLVKVEPLDTTKGYNYDFLATPILTGFSYAAPDVDELAPDQDTPPTGSY